MNDVMFDYKLCGKGIQKFRKKENLSIDKFLDLVNLNRAYYVRIEQGKAQPSTKTVVKICNSLNVTINDCLSAEPDMEKVFYRQFKHDLNGFDEKEKQLLFNLMKQVNEFKR